MGLPPLYHEGRDNPPNPEIWINYFLHMVELYSQKVCEISKDTTGNDIESSLSYLSLKEKQFLPFLLEKGIFEFRPIDISKILGVTNKTVINRCAILTKNGFLIPNIAKERILSYSLSNLAKRSKEVLNFNN